MFHASAYNPQWVCGLSVLSKHAENKQIRGSSRSCWSAEKSNILIPGPSLTCDFLRRSSLGDWGSSSLTDTADPESTTGAHYVLVTGVGNSSDYQSFVIVESSRLKTCEIIKSNLWLNTTMPKKPACKVPCLLFLNTSRDSDSTTSLESIFQCLATLSMRKFFLISNKNLPWLNLRPFPLSYCWLPGRGDWPPPDYSLSSGSCRDW